MLAQRVLKTKLKKGRSQVNLGVFCSNCKNWNLKGTVKCDWCQFILIEIEKDESLPRMPSNWGPQTQNSPQFP